MEFRKLGIVGGGTMGKSLAEKAASVGIDVVVVEVSQEKADQAREQLTAALDRELEKWGITASEKKVVLARARFTADFQELAETDAVIEMVTEDLGVKRKVMKQLGELCPPDRIFATNTSTLSVTEIAAASGRPDRVLGMHFMRPITRSPIVEMVRGASTSDATFEHALTLARALEKTPIRVAERPGYVVTRVILPLLNEAMLVVQEGVASAEDVDQAFRLAHEFRVGPLEYADRIGLDKVLSWMEHLHGALGDAKYQPCLLLRELVEAGNLGCRTGRGFFVYDGRRRAPNAGKEAVR